MKTGKCFCFYCYNETIFPPYLQLKNCYYCYCNRSVILKMCYSSTGVCGMSDSMENDGEHFHFKWNCKFFIILNFLTAQCFNTSILTASHEKCRKMENVCDTSITCNFFFTFLSCRSRTNYEKCI